MTRSKGQSAIARAAYNARERIRDDRSNAVKDYRSFGEPEWKEIFAPDHAPEWARDRQELWNAVERREDQSTRPDQAQLARDFKIALPHELNAEQRRALVQDFGRDMAGRGMVIDVAIHAPDKNNDERNFHVHMLATMREIGPDGFGKKVREWNRDTELEAWRERWSELGAEHLDRAGFELEAERFKVGHLTLQKQREAALQRGDIDWADALDRTPTKHLGPNASAMEDRGISTIKGDANREIEQRNQQRAKDQRLSRTDGEIRLWYQLTDRAQAFADALEDRGLILARVAEGDLAKLAAIEGRRAAEKEAEHQRKLGYLDGRIADEQRRGNLAKAEDLEDRRKEVHDRHQAALPWMKRADGAAALSDEQRDAAERSYDQWKHKSRYSFENYVSYVQTQWRDRAPDQSRFRQNDLVVVNQFGDVHPLTERNTGEAPKLLRKYLREIDTAPLFSVTGAWEVLKVVGQQRAEEKRWREREAVWPTRPPDIKQEKAWTDSPDFHTVEFTWRRAANRAVRSDPKLDAPEALNKSRDAARIWNAFNRNKHDAKAFAEALNAHGIVLCAATKSEADQSYRRAAFAKELNRFSPTYREGEILAMGAGGRVYKLNQRTTGAETIDIARLLKKLDKTKLRSIGEAAQVMNNRAEAREAGAQLIGAMRPGRGQESEPEMGFHLRRATGTARNVASRGINVVEGPTRALLGMFDLAANAFESLFCPVLTPAQRRQGEFAERKRRREGEAAEQDRRRDGEFAERQRRRYAAKAELERQKAAQITERARGGHER